MSLYGRTRYRMGSPAAMRLGPSLFDARGEADELEQEALNSVMDEYGCSPADAVQRLAQLRRDAAEANCD